MPTPLPSRFRYAWVACAQTNPCTGSQGALLHFKCQYWFTPWHHPVYFYSSENAAFKQYSYFWYQRFSQILCHPLQLLSHFKRKAQKTAAVRNSRERFATLLCFLHSSLVTWAQLLPTVGPLLSDSHCKDTLKLTHAMLQPKWFLTLTGWGERTFNLKENLALLSSLGSSNMD